MTKTNKDDKNLYLGEAGYLADYVWKTHEQNCY